MIEFLEAAMITAFSASWYCSIAKMLRTGQAAGKSLRFVVLVGLGYACGMGSKAVVWHETGIVPPILALYVWNFLIVGIDAWLVLTLNRRRRALS